MKQEGWSVQAEFRRLLFYMLNIVQVQKWDVKNANMVYVFLI
jgi:hypothetical protein